MSEERVDQSHFLFGDHVDHADDPCGMQKNKLGGPPPKGVRDRQVVIVLGCHNVEKWVIQHRQDRVVGELQFKPRRPVLPVNPQLVCSALVEFDRIVSMAEGELVL